MRRLLHPLVSICSNLSVDGRQATDYGGLPPGALAGNDCAHTAREAIQLDEAAHLEVLRLPDKPGCEDSRGHVLRLDGPQGHFSVDIVDDQELVREWRVVTFLHFE
eukprot:CAMPEP_0170454040 /NCGR_PEP_ID=MMETSP0123-20130129/2424_1 /TAXON_ID=182087 /ORGANISM="Favella ehrenbergii, Strain Fehren 1" /LENGTH=105 /DNA_ID=CAMNT_0010716619 /DNA_START=3152 /DNA_END=3470 /DNA_ORIENTATION=+